MIKRITSKDNEIIKYVLKLQNNAFSRQEKKFIVEGDHLIEMSKKYIDFILCLETFKNIQLYNNVYIIDEKLMKKISQNSSFSDVVGVCKYIDSKPITGNRVLYLDNVQDPGNVGTILRTALAFGINDVILSTGCAFKYAFKTIQASQGSVFKLNVLNGDKELLSMLQKNGYKLVSTSLDVNSVFLSNLNFKKSDNYVIILGNEGNGISKDIQSLSDIKVKIEIENIDSLNVGVAGGIIMYAFSTLRKKDSKNE